MKSKKEPAARKTSARAPKISETPRAPAIDYPGEGDMIYSTHYAVRISLDAADAVEISIDNGAWQACRNAAGYYWFDWQPDSEGIHRLEVRARVGKGRWRRTDVRSCQSASPQQG